jgi:hypothetical protein
LDTGKLVVGIAVDTLSTLGHSLLVLP